MPQNKQIELAFEETETVTPTGITETTETAETVKKLLAHSLQQQKDLPQKTRKKILGQHPRRLTMQSLEGQIYQRNNLKVLEGRGAPTEFTPAAVVDEQLERGETVSETDFDGRKRNSTGS